MICNSGDPFTFSTYLEYKDTLLAELGVVCEILKMKFPNCPLFLMLDVMWWEVFQKKASLNLEDGARGLLLLLHGLILRGDDGADALIEALLQALLGEGRALDEFVCVDFLGEGHTLLIRDGSEAVLSEALEHLFVLAQIDLGGSENDRSVGAMMMDLRVPLGANVFEGGRVDSGVENEEDVGLRIRQGSKSIVVVLTSSIPKTQVVGLSIEHHIGAIVIEDSGEIILGEGIGSVRDEHGGLSDGSVSNYDALDGSEQRHG